MKIKRTTNEGNPRREFKELDVSSLNIYPEVLIADNPANVFDVSLLENYDTFMVENTAGATDEFSLPASIPKGTVIKFLPVNGFIITSEVGSGVGINGGDDDQGVSAGSANGYVWMVKASDDNWIMNFYAVDGSATAPTPVGGA